MCGVIVVDAGRSRSTNLGRDAYIHDHCLGYRHNYLVYFNFPTVICVPIVAIFREKPLVKSTGLGSIFLSYTFRSILLFAFTSICNFYSQIYIIKNTKIPCCVLFVVRPFASINLSIYQSTTREGLTTPLPRGVASICSLCAGTVYIVLHGYPTGSITLVSSQREILTVVVLHHPFLFGEIPT